jgi:hypothetical protein
MHYISKTHISKNETGVEEIMFEREATINDYVSQLFKKRSFKHITSIKTTWIRKSHTWLNKETHKFPTPNELHELAMFRFEIRQLKEESRRN